MRVKHYMSICMFIFLFLLYERQSINLFPSLSFFALFQSLGIFSKELVLTTGPGKTLSYYFGWIGLGIMLLTNLYIFRKRVHALTHLGDIERWLDIHIFFGVLGPTFIVFHSDFNVRGIVAISFWSMIISVVSGFIGRYFYVNTKKKQLEWKILSDKKLKEIAISFAHDPKRVEIVRGLAKEALTYMGVERFKGNVSILSLPFFALCSLTGDIRMKLGRPVLKKYAKMPLDKRLKEYGSFRRNEIYTDTYRRLLSYWHVFHFPFTIFMYITAAIHIVSSLIFKV